MPNKKDDKAEKPLTRKDFDKTLTQVFRKLPKKEADSKSAKT